MSDTNQSQNDSGTYLLAYFRQIYGGRVEVDAAGQTQVVTLTETPMSIEALHLAVSEDGRHWNALNNNEPVLAGVWMRDPFVNRGPDGFFHLVATGGNDGPRSCLYLRSRDLVEWDAPRALPLMTGVPEARNLWAPEWFYDEREESYLLFWSSSFEDAGWKKSRLWYCRTSDFQTFSKPGVLFAPPYSVIDGTLLVHKGTYFLFYKEEEFGAQKGERRAIRLATADAIEGPYTIYEGPLNDGQIVPVITEGPSVMPDPDGAGWLLLYDFCMSDGYGVSHSLDLRHWETVSDVAFPANARHGSVLALSPEEAARLRQRFPAAGLPKRPV